jgi:hypothetical protein
MIISLAACGGGEPTQHDSSPAEASGFQLPADGELPGWSRVTEPEHYVADNLWDYINGQADFFIDYGFVRVDAAEYRKDQEASSVVLEVYRMGRPREAFGIFAAERTSEDRPLEIGSGAYLGANVLGFWQGEHYVKLTTFDEGPEMEKMLTGLAEEVSSRLPSRDHDLQALSLFPAEGRIAASERFIPKNFLGQPFLTEAFRVDSSHDGERVQLFIIESGSPTEAQSRFTRLEDFYRQRDQEQVTLETAGDLPLLVVNGPSKTVVFQLDSRLGGATGTQNLEAARMAARALAEKMRG